MFPGRRRNRSYYGLNRVDSEVQEATPENLRIEIDQIFKEFMSNVDANEYIFPSNLNNLQRKYIHEKAKIMNIVSKSYGNPPNRKLHIKKKPKSSSCHSFGITPCDESLAVLSEFMDTTDYTSMPLKNDQPRQLQDKVFGKLTDLPPAKVLPSQTPAHIVKFKMNLPVTAMKQEILEKVRLNQVLILSSETGSGKTTQIPQFLMEEMYLKKMPCKIICTQPRRISTVSVAERVSEERGEYVGEAVGYHIRLEQKYGLNTGLIYCTNGVLLRSLMCGSKILSNVTHLIIDEVHERDRLSDFLLICIKQNLQKYPKLRIILMSATVNVEKFRNYFINAEVFTLPGRQFPIQEYFLDDILVNLNYMSPSMQSMKARGVDTEIPISSICEYQNIAMDQALEDYVRCNGDFMQPSAQVALYILSEGISVDYQHSQTGMTALMVAAAYGDEMLVSNLLNLGTNINIQCRSGKTALDYARENTQDRVYNLLMFYKNSLEQPHTRSPSKDLLALYDKTITDEEIDYDLVIALLKSIHNTQQEGAVLIFLPGYDDIMMCNDRILDSGLDRRAYKTFFLHGSMNIRDQHEVFKHLPNNQRKIILSTNIAETSITIDDVVFVIDCGKAKEKSYDSYNKLSSLQTMWISQACVKQRAGRAGRTRPGVCFHLFSQQRFSNMDKERVPEILRVSLEELCLHTKILAPLNMDIFTFLAQAPDPPSANSVKVAIESLQALGALDELENLTKLGEYLAQLTIEPRLGKMLIYSVIFRCLEPILTLTASLAHKDPFQLPPQANLKTLAAEKRRSLTDDVPSDHLIYLKAFIKWQFECQQGKGYEFCRDHFISKSTMESILDTRRQLLGQLRASGFIPQANSIQEFNRYADSWPMVKAVISSGLYPHLAFPNGTAYSTRNEKKVFIPNTSVLGKIKVNAWVVFDEPVKNKNNFYIRGNTAVSPITISLLCGNSTEPVCGSTFIIDKWLEIEGLNENILNFRIVIRYLIDKLLNNPTFVYTKPEYKILETLQKVLFNEDISLQLPQAINIGSKPQFFHHVVDRSRGPRQQFEVSHMAHRENNIERRHNIRNYNGDVDNVTRNFHNVGLTDRFRISNTEERYRDVPDDVLYILIKPRQIRSVNIAFHKETWVFAPQTEKKIIFYSNKDKEVRLIFTVHNSNCFQGIAKFLSLSQIPGKPTAFIEWMFKFDVPYSKARQLRNPYNDERPIYEGLDGQLIEQSVAEELVRVFGESLQQLSH